MLEKLRSSILKLKHLNVITLAAVILSSALLIGAFYFPFIHSTFNLDLPDWLPDWFGLHDELTEWVVKKGKIPTGDQYLLGIIKSLFEDGSILLGIIIFLFSVVFPVLKIMLSGIYIAGTFGNAKRQGNGLLKAIGIVSKWSMADVFIVAVIIVMFKAKGFNFTFTPETGIYCYTLSAIASSLIISFISSETDSA